MTRTDDVINVAGHRLSTGRIEEVIPEVKGVVECAVIGKEDEMKGEVPVAFVILQDKGDPEKADKEIQKIVREKVGAFAKLDKVVFVQKLPKTRSGKILRNLLRDITNQKEKPRITPTIEDKSIIPDLIATFKKTYGIQ